MNNNNNNLFFWHLKWIIFTFFFTSLLSFILYFQTIYNFDIVTYLWENLFFPYLNPYWRNQIAYLWDYYFPIFFVPAIYIVNLNDTESTKLYKFYAIIFVLLFLFFFIFFSIPDFIIEFLIDHSRMFINYYFNYSVLQWLDLFWDVFIPVYYIPIILKEHH